MRKLIIVILAVAALTPGLARAQEQPFLPFYWVNGMVMGAVGVDVSNRTVVLYHQDFPQFKLTASTEAGGEFSVNIYELNYFHSVPIAFGAPDYRLAVLQAAADGLGVDEVTVTLLSANGFTTVNTELATGEGALGSLYGVVSDANTPPNPIAGVTVTISTRTDTTNATGNYAINGITAGTYPVTATAPGGASTIVPGVVITAGVATEENITIASVPLSITTLALPAGTVGVAYSQTLAASGGTTPYSWALAPGNSLPAGLSLNSSSGVISGTPTAVGSDTFNVTVTDNAGQSVTATFSLTVSGAAGTGPIINVTALLEGFIGKPTTVRVEARTGEATADTALPANIAGTAAIALDVTGVGTNNGTWDNNVNPPAVSGGYFLVIRHRLGTGEGNHLPVILTDKVNLLAGAGSAANINLATAPAFQPAPGLVPALKTLAGGNLALRAGYLNDDNIIDISDYSIWKGAVTPAGTINLSDPNSVRSDLNGDNIIDISDYALWKGTVQDFTPGGVPQTGNHIYVP